MSRLAVRLWESLHDGDELIALEKTDADVVLLEKGNVRLLQQLRCLHREVEHAFERHQLTIDLGVRDVTVRRCSGTRRGAVAGCERERLSNDGRLLLTGLDVLPTDRVRCPLRAGRSRSARSRAGLQTPVV